MKSQNSAAYDIMLIGLLGSCLGAASCSERSGLSLSVTGTITLGGQPRAIRQCAMEGSRRKHNSMLVLTLDNGAVFKLPINEGSPMLDGTATPCNKTTQVGAGTDHSYHGQIAATCGDLVLDINIQCGSHGPSNRKPKHKPKGNRTTSPKQQQRAT